jgi:putative transposase
MLTKTFKYKLRPSLAQKRALSETLALCRLLYNAAVSERREVWCRRGMSLGYYDQKAELPDLKRALPEYASVHSQVLQDVILRVERTFSMYFGRVRSGEIPGYPRFQGDGRYRSFTYPQYGNGVQVDNGFIVLSKIGRIAVRWSRPLEGTPKTVTISREGDDWYVCIACECVPERPLPRTGQETGIDLGLTVFLTTADGWRVENPRYLRRAERALKKAHRRVSRRKLGSGRRRKTVQCLAKAYQKVRRQRADHRHKTALALVQRYDSIYYEHLTVAKMARNPQRAKSIGDVAWGRFCITLAFKAECAGKRAIAVSPAFTTQQCSNPDCGKIVPKGLSVRWHRCDHCGTVLDRDENAARNILRLGREQSMQRLGQSLRGVGA